MPAGIIYGIWAGPMVLLGDMTWFPWASKRNVIECSLKFLRDIDLYVVGYSSTDDKDFFVHLCKYGVIRRVGTLYGLSEDRSAFFEVRKKWAE